MFTCMCMCIYTYIYIYIHIYTYIYVLVLIIHSPEDSKNRYAAILDGSILTRGSRPCIWGERLPEQVLER